MRRLTDLVEAVAILFGFTLGAFLALPLDPGGILGLLGIWTIVAIIFELRFGRPRDRGINPDRRKW